MYILKLLMECFCLFWIITVTHLNINSLGNAQTFLPYFRLNIGQKSGNFQADLVEFRVQKVLFCL